MPQLLPSREKSVLNAFLLSYFCVILQIKYDTELLTVELWPETEVSLSSSSFLLLLLLLLFKDKEELILL